MKQLSFRTGTLLRRHPQLFLPSLIYAFLQFWTGRSRTLISHSFLHLLFPQRMNSLFDISGPSPNQILLASMPVAFLFYLVEAALFIAALAVTYILVSKILRVERSGPRLRSCALVCVLLAGIRFALTLLELMLGILLVKIGLKQPALPGLDLAIGLVSLALESFLIAPLLLSALGAEERRTDQSANLSRIGYFIAQFCSRLFELLLLPLAIAHASRPHNLAPALVVRLVSSLPFAALFVFLSLVSEQDLSKDPIANPDQELPVPVVHNPDATL